MAPSFASLSNGRKEGRNGGAPPVICISRSGSAPNPPSASNQKDRGDCQTNKTTYQSTPYAWQILTKKRVLVCCWANKKIRLKTVILSINGNSGYAFIHSSGVLNGLPWARKWLPSREVMHSATTPRRYSYVLSLSLPLSLPPLLPLHVPFAPFLASNSRPEKPFGIAYAYYPIVYKSVLVRGVPFTFASHNLFLFKVEHFPTFVL